MRPFLRPLLPATDRPPLSSLPLSRRDRISAACDQCRIRKTKCTGKRPVCGECLKRSTSCHYAALSSETQGQALKRRHDELQSQNEDYTELFSLVRSRPGNEAHEILRRIRMGGEVSSVLRHVKEADLLIQLTLRPETRRRYSLPYSKSMPAFLLVPDNEYLTAPLYEAPFEQDDAALGQTDSDPYMKPQHAAEIVEPLLDRVCAKDWTTILTDNGLFRRLIALFLKHQHTTYQWFHKGLFLEDMAARSTSFCSKLLVHAVLAAGCQPFTDIPELQKVWLPNNLQSQLLLETKRLWELEQDDHRITSIHAAIVLHGTLIINGMDKEGLSYTLLANTMARKIRLFEIPPSHSTARMRRAREYTAWALWSWNISVDYNFRQTPSLKHPPFRAPDPDMDPSWYAEVYLQYHTSTTLTPVHYGHITKATLDFRLILAEICRLQYTDLESQQMTQEQFSEILSRLNTWMHDLPTALQAKNVTLPCQLKIHAEYQMVLHNLIQTQMAVQSPPPCLLDGRTALQIRNDAHVRLETLMRLWYLRHSFSTYEPWALLFLVYLGNLAIRSLNEPSEETPLAPIEVFRSTVVLSINGSDSQSYCYYLGALISRSMIERLSPQDAERMGPHLAQSAGTPVEGPFDSEVSICPVVNTC
ncbi:hypothetical protein NX059_001576 [Plenodomus lindquistii]|nr:hypothetical protein NX059_001576 [Plenodomus lindquistii]